MTRNTDDRYLREAVLTLAEAMRAMATDSGRGLALIAEAEEIAKRVDVRRGTANPTGEPIDLGELTPRWPKPTRTDAAPREEQGG